MHGAAENQTHEKLICKTLHSFIVNSQNIIFQAEAFLISRRFTVYVHLVRTKKKIKSLCLKKMFSRDIFCSHTAYLYPLVTFKKSVKICIGKHVLAVHSNSTAV